MATVSNLNPNDPGEDIVSRSSNPGGVLGSPMLTSPTSRQRRRRSPDELAVQEAEKEALTPTRRKRMKINEEEATKDEGLCDDDDSVSSRLDKLAEIVRILEKFKLYLYEADASPPSLNEQRLCLLSYSHVNSYIFLYHLEKNKINNHPNDKEEPPEFPSEEGKKVEVLIDGRDLEQTMWETVEGDMLFTSCLTTCRSSFRPADVKNSLALGIYEVPVYNEAQRLREQQLLDVLNTLEVIGEWRDYSPPTSREEVQYYKMIRKCLISSLACIIAKGSAQAISGKRNWIVLRENHLENHPTEAQDLFFFFPGHRLAVVFELIPEYRALLQECKHRVSRIFSSCPQDAAKGDTTDISEDDRNVSQTQLIRWEPKRSEAGMQPGSRIMTRLECLKLIGARIKDLGSFGGEPPTQREVRLCTMIAEHIRSSFLHFANRNSLVPEANKPSCQVYIGDDADYSGLSRSQGVGTREQVLEQIMSFLKAFRSSFFAQVPTKEEGKEYLDLWKILRPSLMACLGSEIPEADVISGPVITAAKHNLLFVYKSLVGFFEELRAEFRKILAIVHGATLSAEGLSLNEALTRSTEGREKVEGKLREFFSKPVPGRIDQLDQTIQTLNEVDYLGVGIFYRLGAAIKAIDAGWHDEKYEMVEEEVNNALKVICSEKVFGI